MCMHGRLVGVATVCMHSSCVIWQIAWSKEPEDRCMQKPEYRARDVATLEDFLQILYNCMMHAWLFDGIILHWYMIVIWVSAISFCYCFWSRFCACLLQLHILSKTPLGHFKILSVLPCKIDSQLQEYQYSYWAKSSCSCWPVSSFDCANVSCNSLTELCKYIGVDSDS